MDVNESFWDHHDDGVVESYFVVQELNPSFAIPIIKLGDFANARYIQNVSGGGLVRYFDVCDFAARHTRILPESRTRVRIGGKEIYVILDPNGVPRAGTRSELSPLVSKWIESIGTPLVRLNFAEFANQQHHADQAANEVYFRKLNSDGQKAADAWFLNTILFRRIQRAVLSSPSAQVDLDRWEMLLEGVSFELSERDLDIQMSPELLNHMESLRDFGPFMGRLMNMCSSMGLRRFSWQSVSKESGRQRGGAIGRPPIQEHLVGLPARRTTADFVELPGPLAALDAAIRDGRLPSLCRSLAQRLLENGGVLARRQVENETKALSQAERRMLRGLGVRIGAFSLHLPGLWTNDPMALARLVVADPAAPVPGRITRLMPGPVNTKSMSARELMAVGGLAVPVSQLEKLDAARRAGPRRGSGWVVTDELLEELGWNPKDATDILRGLGFVPVNRTQPLAWRRRPVAKPSLSDSLPDSPFAVLAKLLVPEPVRKARRPRRKKPRTDS